MKTGWITVDGKTYYMSTVSSRYGQAITGWMQKGGAYYYFNEKGVMQKGWLTLGNKKYYLDPSTGKMTTGKKTIDGKSYDFGKSGYITIDTTPTGPWSIKVNQSTCVVTIYRGSTPVKALICSVGLGGATPTGTFYLPGTKHRWHELFGNVYGQYTTTITGNILFHSVYYYTCGNNRTLSVQQYNKLGYPASAGCVRLTVAGAKYIYDNCPAGTKVTIFYGSSADDPPQIQISKISKGAVALSILLHHYAKYAFSATAPSVVANYRSPARNSAISSNARSSSGPSQTSSISLEQLTWALRTLITLFRLNVFSPITISTLQSYSIACWQS